MKVLAWKNLADRAKKNKKIDKLKDLKKIKNEFISDI